MVKTRYEREINAPRKLVFEILRDRQAEINLKLPNIAGCEVIEDCAEDGCRRRIVTEVTARAPIPMLIKPILSRRQLVWRGIQTWDDKNWICDYTTEALYFRENVDVTGRWYFDEKAPGRTALLIVGVVKIDAKGVPGLPAQLAPPVSALVEYLIKRMTRPNLDKVCDTVELMIREEKRAARRKGKL